MWKYHSYSYRDRYRPNRFTHVHSCVARYTQTKHAPANSNRHTDMYYSMLTYVHTLTETHHPAHRPDTYT